MQAPVTTVLGIDFGTTNSVVSALDTDTGRVTTARFSVGGVEHDVFRSVLCFWTEPTAGRSQLHHAAGPAAIETYLDDPLDSRLVMSTKTYLASRSFTSTALMGRIWTLEQLIGLFLRELSKAARLDPAALQVVVGRPVRFAGDQADDVFGETRLRAAFACVLRFDPAATAPITALGGAGVGIAGDAFDARIMDRVVAPLLGKGSHYSPWGNALPVPAEWYTAFARWHRLSLMRSPRTLRDIAEVRRTAEAPERLDHLLQLIEDEQGYGLYRAVSAAKAALSGADRTVLRFAHRGFAIEQPITRADFEAWIAPELARMDAAIGDALAAAGVAADGVDRVFLTGGTAFVPAVRALFERRFGAERVSGGGEFVSVAEGLALIGGERLQGQTSS
jgi:hypothetical chaperone protein